MPSGSATSLPEALPGRKRTPLVRLVRHSLLRAGVRDCRLVVGCSGGPDSTALLLALGLLAPELGLGLHVVAIDHGLRPEGQAESEAVCRLAQVLGFAAASVRVVVPSGASRQAQARTARYQALAEAARRCAAPFIAVGHTRDDQTETVLMRLLGGAGLTGLAGMALTSPLPLELDGAQAALLRPLLTTSRAQVESFLQPLVPLLVPLPFQDPSNGDPRYLRARLRRDVLPLLRELAPHLDDRILHLAEQLRADAEHLEDAAEQALVGLVGLVSEPHADAVTLPVAAVSALPRALQARVLHRAARVSLGQRHIEALMGLCRSQAGAQELHLPMGLCARRQGGLLTLRWSQTS